ncbi:MAG: arsenate reductase ArsC [Rhodobacteraceae bacterium]|nr:arsenate reductase ArsC [Paracoccaceae bacterium]
MNVLVLCTGNSARSILLEAILNAAGDGRVRAWSAGSNPAGQVHPQSLRLLQARGLPVAGLRSKSWDEFAGPDAPKMDAVVTVCGSAAGETCPVWPGAPVRAHWGVDDPAAAPPDDQPRVFQDTFERLQGRADAFLALPFDTMSAAELRAELKRIGEMA